MEQSQKLRAYKPHYVRSILSTAAPKEVSVAGKTRREKLFSWLCIPTTQYPKNSRAFLRTQGLTNKYNT
jgi:hypothetical protein